MIRVIAFDADDTLWRNEDRFQRTTVRFAEMLASYASAESVVAHLDETEGRNNELFGFGIKGFTLSMVETAVAVSGGTIAAAAIGEIVAMGKAMLEAPVDLLDGVPEVLASLGRRFPLYMITKGDNADQGRKVEESGMAGHFASVEIVVRKDVATYGDIFRRHGIDTESLMMVGNSVPSDILPVLELGGWAAHIPYTFTASFERHPSQPEHARFFELETIRQLPGLVDRLQAGAGATNQA